MSLHQWLNNSWIRPIGPSAEVVADLLGVADREIADASLTGISADGKFEHAYSAVRVLCQLALHACGYVVPKGQREHERTIDSLKFTLDGDWVAEVNYFDRCRRRRHQSLYDRSGVTQHQDANELLDAASRLNTAVRVWLRSEHTDLI